MGNRSTSDRAKGSETAVYTGDKDGEFSYIAMEYVPGDNLEQRISNRETLSLEKILHISDSLAEAIDFCHVRGIEHNDIKLKNLKEKKIYGIINNSAQNHSPINI